MPEEIATKKQGQCERSTTKNDVDDGSKKFSNTHTVKSIFTSMYHKHTMYW